MHLKATKSLILPLVFLLTSKTEAKDLYYQKAQKFFAERNKAESETKYNTPNRSISQTHNYNLSNQHASNPMQAKQYVGQQGQFFKKDAIYLSLMNEKYGSTSDGGPEFRTSFGISLPILHAKGGKTQGEFMLYADIRNSSEWGRVKFLHRESLNLLRLNDTLIEGFLGAGLGYGFGNLIQSSEKLFAPWALGVYFNQIYKSHPVFFRFELGFTGEIIFSSQSHNTGFFGNISLGYKI